MSFCSSSSQRVERNGRCDRARVSRLCAELRSCAASSGAAIPARKASTKASPTASSSASMGPKAATPTCPTRPPGLLSPPSRPGAGEGLRGRLPGEALSEVTLTQARGFILGATPAAPAVRGKEAKMIPALPLVGKILVDSVASGVSAVLSPQDSNAHKVGAATQSGDDFTQAVDDLQRTAATGTTTLGAHAPAEARRSRSASWPGSTHGCPVHV